MSNAIKARKESKRLKSDKKEFIKEIIEEPRKGSFIKKDNEFSIFNLKNIDLINKSNEIEEKNKEDINQNETKKNEMKNINDYNNKCIISPHECRSLPLIIINPNKNTVFSQCPANGYSNELTNPHEPDEVMEIPINDYLKKISEPDTHVKCSKCNKKYNPSINKKNHNKSNSSEEEEDEEEEEEEDDEDNDNQFFLCYSCNKYFCKKCKEEHVKHLNVNDKSLIEKHYVINVDCLPCRCLYHNEKYLGYCNNCKQNVCIECLNGKLHKSHEIVFFKNIMINSKEVSEIKNKINIEKKNLEFFENLFMESINKIKTKFYNLLENKKEICRLKEILINQYEKHSYNYQTIMTCLKMEFNAKNLTIFSKLKDENSFDLINLIFDTLNETPKYTYKKTKTDNFSKKKENLNNDDNKNINKMNKSKEKDIKEESKSKKVKKKKIHKKIISNSFSIDLNEEENNVSQVNINKENSNNSLINNNSINNSNGNKKNLIRVKKNNNILNNSKDTKEHKDKSDLSRNIFNKKVILNNLSSKPIEEEKPKEEETDEGNDDDLLFFPKKKSFRKKDKKMNKIAPLQLKNLGEEFLLSDEGGGKDSKTDKDKIKSPKFKKNKIYKMKGNENLKDLILEDIQNKGELFSSLKVGYNYNQELFGVENSQKITEPDERPINKENKENKEIKENKGNKDNEDNKDKDIIEDNNNKDNNKNNNISKENSAIKKEKKIENEISNIDLNNINLANINNSKESSKTNSKRKSKKKLVMIKNEFSIDKNLINNSNLNTERDIKLLKGGNENKSDNNIRNSFFLSDNMQKELTSEANLNISNTSHNNNSKISNIKIYKHHNKNKNNELCLLPYKRSQDCIHIPSKEKNEKTKKQKLAASLKEIKNNEDNEIVKSYLENEEYEDSLSFDSLIKEKKNNKFEKKNSKLLMVKKHLIEKPNNSINSNNEASASMENSMKIKKDSKGRIYSVKIKNDPVWCVLSMKNNEYMSVGLASGIIRIFNQNDFNPKLNIEEHTGAIYSMYLTKKNSNCFLTSSTDKLIKKILVSDNFNSYTVISTLIGHNSSIYKAIELNNNLILSCSDDGFLIMWENYSKKEDENNKNDEIDSSNNNVSSPTSNFNKLNFINDFLNIESSGSTTGKKNNKYVMNKKLNQMLNKGEIIYDILQINNEIFISSSLYGNLRFWNINTMTNTDTIKDIQCNDSHNCLCIINKTVIAVLLNGKYGVALIDYIKKEVTHKIIIEKNLEIKLSTILLTSNKIVVIGGQNNSMKDESQVIYKYYKIIKVKKANSSVFKYSLKFLNEHVKKSQKLTSEDDIWLNAMTEGGNGTIINGLGSTFMNKEYGQIYLFFKESLIDMNKENKNSINDNNRNKKQ